MLRNLCRARYLRKCQNRRPWRRGLGSVLNEYSSGASFPRHSPLDVWQPQQGMDQPQSGIAGWVCPISLVRQGRREWQAKTDPHFLSACAAATDARKTTATLTSAAAAAWPGRVAKAHASSTAALQRRSTTWRQLSQPVQAAVHDCALGRGQVHLSVRRSQSGDPCRRCPVGGRRLRRRLRRISAKGVAAGSPARRDPGPHPVDRFCGRSGRNRSERAAKVGTRLIKSAEALLQMRQTTFSRHQDTFDSQAIRPAPPCRPANARPALFSGWKE